MSVYTSLSDEALATLLKLYDFGEVTSFQGISEGIENTNYFVSTSKDNTEYHFVLTIFESLTFTELPYFLDLMAFLAKHEIPCANPIVDKSGQFIQKIQGKPAALVAKLEGSSIVSAKIDHCAQVGTVLAKLHNAGECYPEQRENPRDLAWMKVTAERVSSRLPLVDQQLLDAEIQFQQGYANVQLSQGVIHADLFRDNALFANEKLSGVIDFYYACSGLHLYDLAVTVNDWCSDKQGALQSEKVRTMLDSYNRVRNLKDEDKLLWPIMLRAAALRFWLSRLLDMHLPREGELTHIKDPTVFKKILINRINTHDAAQEVWVN